MKKATSRTARLWSDPRLLAWTLLSLVAFPLVLLGKLRRHFLLGYEWEFVLRRWTVPPPPGDLTQVVFVGAGPGELIMIDRLIVEMKQQRPEVTIGICLKDLDAIDRLRVERPDQRFTIWPYDFLIPVSHWLRSERPDLVVFVDRFRFTTLACGAARFGAKLALVNGRSRVRKSLLYRLAAPYYRWQLGGFAALAMADAASEVAAHRFATPNCVIAATGSIKADASPISTLADKSLSNWLSSAPFVSAGSTRDAEEEAMVLDAFIITKAANPCRLLIAPRDSKRVYELRTLAESKGLTVSRRSTNESPADVHLLDTFGELSAAYGLTKAAYVGGSYTKGGSGHNVMEPLAHGVPVAYGLERGNFASLQQLCEARGVGTRISGKEELTLFWTRFLENPDERNHVATEARRLVEEAQGATCRTVDLLLPLLPEAAA